MIKKYILFLLAILISATVPAISSNAAQQTTGIMIEPMRIEILDNERSSKATIYNQSQTSPVGYIISTTARRMKEDGTLFTPDKMTKREALALSMFRFSPRMAELAPSGKQVVRIAVRKPPKLPDGEYFTYLSIQPVDTQEKKKERIKPENKSSDGLGMSIEMRVGVSIPVILRVGELHVTTALKSVKRAMTPNGKKALEITLSRSGNRSSYVGVNIYSSINGQETLVGQNRRVVTYIPLSTRKVIVPITENKYMGGITRIELFDYESKKILESKQYKI